MQARKLLRPASGVSDVSRNEMFLTISSAWSAGLFTQVEAATSLQMNQGQVSRIICGKFKRPTGHAASLFAYAKKKLESRPDVPVTRDDQALRSMLIWKLMETWDHTATGAEALANLLEAARQLKGEC